MKILTNYQDKIKGVLSTLDRSMKLNLSPVNEKKLPEKFHSSYENSEYID